MSRHVYHFYLERHIINDLQSAAQFILQMARGSWQLVLIYLPKLIWNVFATSPTSFVHLFMRKMSSITFWQNKLWLPAKLCGQCCLSSLSISGIYFDFVEVLYVPLFSFIHVCLLLLIFWQRVYCWLWGSKILILDKNYTELGISMKFMYDNFLQLKVRVC